MNARWDEGGSHGPGEEREGVARLGVLVRGKRLCKSS